MPKHCIIAIILSFLISTALFAATGPLPDDPNLDKPVTLAIKGEALSDIAEMLGKQSGAELRVTKEIADQKATIFVDEKPLRDVMLALETLFGFRWSVKIVNEKRVYELWMTEKTRKEREAGWNAALNKAWDDADAQIKLVAELSRLSPEEQKRLMEKGISKPEDITLFEALNLEKPIGASGVIARFYASLPRQIKDALRAGCSIHYDTNSPEQEWHVPDEIIRDLIASINKPEIRESTNNMQVSGVNIEISPRISEEGFYVTYKINMISNEGNFVWGDGGLLCNVMPIVEIPISEADQLSHKPIDPILQKETTITAEELVSEAAIFGQIKTDKPIHATLSDVLALLHNKLELQIISDYYSDWTEGNYNIGNLPANTRLIFTKMRTPSYLWGWDGTYLFVRCSTPCLMDQKEIPNRILKPLQDAFKQQGYLGIDELAQIASLSDEQIRSMAGNTRFLGLSTNDYSISGNGVSTDNLLLWVYALRFYNTLTPAQKKQIIETGVLATSLTSSQRAVLNYCGGNIASNHKDNRVGIWKDGIRIDKPGMSSPSDPVSIVFQQMWPLAHLFTFTSGGSSVSFQALSADAAREILKSNPEAQKGNGKLFQQAGYMMMVIFADGKSMSTQIPIEIPLSIN
ncbi:MAG: hypothetical protein ACYC27_22035 [Armatimonadota bacterium]